jgi:FkbM family methyltransferase
MTVAARVVGTTALLFVIYLTFPRSIATPISWPTPRRCVAPLHTMRFHGQDLFDAQIYRTYFSNVCNGTFVEVGANDGETLSQSLVFEDQLGWRGICIEPQPEKYQQLVKRRPLCVNVNAGISSGESSTMTFIKIIGYSDMLSSFEQYITPKHWERIRKEVALYNQTIERIPVKRLPLSEVLATNNLTSIDYMSIDTEGNEYEVLASIDWSITRVGLFFIESGPVEKDARITKMLIELGYQQKPSIGNNIVFTKLKFG